jgi:hypothetical protein
MIRMAMVKHLGGTASAVDYVDLPCSPPRRPCLICNTMSDLAVKLPPKLMESGPGYLCWPHYEEALWRGIREIEAILGEAPGETI